LLETQSRYQSCGQRRAAFVDWADDTVEYKGVIENRRKVLPVSGLIVFRYRLSIKADLARRRRIEAGNKLREGGFTATVPANDEYDLPRIKRQVNGTNLERSVTVFCCLIFMNDILELYLVPAADFWEAGLVVGDGAHEWETIAPFQSQSKILNAVQGHFRFAQILNQCNNSAERAHEVDNGHAVGDQYVAVSGIAMEFECRETKGEEEQDVGCSLTSVEIGGVNFGRTLQLDDTLREYLQFVSLSHGIQPNLLGTINQRPERMNQIIPCTTPGSQMLQRFAM
jgi:hypothetical protein